MDLNYLKNLDDEIAGDVYIYHRALNEKLDLYSVGCEVSEWDAEKIASMINCDELTKPIIIFNTCAVTSLAQTACEILAHKLKLLFSEKVLFFVGCGVDYNRSYYEQYGICLSNFEKFNHKNYGCNTRSCQQIQHNLHRDVGYVKIEDGCSNSCAYCIINKIRPHFMFSYSAIKSQITALLAQGKTNIQLIGTELTCYHSDGLTLSSLCEKILSDFPTITSLVLGALDPAPKEVNNLISLIKHNPRMFNVLYLSTQSCSDTVLKAMGRRHSVSRLEELFELAGSDVKIVLQVIIGFPGETDELFEETISFFKKYKPVDYDGIVFSPRKGTRAYNLPNKIPKRITDKRERKLYDLVKAYSLQDIQPSDRSFVNFELDKMRNFFSLKPFKPTSVLVCESFADDESFKNLFTNLSLLPKGQVVQTKFSCKESLFDFDVSSKLLTSTFEARILVDVIIDQENLMFFTSTYWTPSVFAYRLGVYPEFFFGEDLTEDSLHSLFYFFKICIMDSIFDFDTLLERLFIANSKLGFSIMEMFNNAKS